MSRWHAVSFVTALMATAIACTDTGTQPDEISPTGSTPAGWQVYSDSSYRFAVSYPPTYSVMAEPSAPPGGAVKRVRFQDATILAGQFAELEPPRLAIEVFEGKPATSSLVDWLRSTGQLTQGAETAGLTLAGAAEGVRVRLGRQLAPNDFFYFSTSSLVYKLTPLGGGSSEMYQSFRLL